MKLILKTERLVLRELEQTDFDDLCLILQDGETMAAYEGAFSGAEVQEWLNRQRSRYEADGFGLWAVLSKEDGSFLGQCGLTVQDCDGKRVVEVGYLFKRRYWGLGYATEAARACKRYAFERLGCTEVYSIIRDTNLPSQRVAERNGMTRRGSFVKHYKGVDMRHYIDSVTREEASSNPIDLK